MQVPADGGLALTQGTLPRYKYFEKDGNQLGEKGVAYLSKIGWGKVQRIDLSIKVVAQMELDVGIKGVDG